MYSTHNFAPEVLELATAVFDRSWQFIERDPMLIGQDREAIKDELGRLILQLVQRGETNLVTIANCAILQLRQDCAADRPMSEAA